MSKEVTRVQVIGWALPVVMAIAGSLVMAYAMVREHEYRLNAIEQREEHKSTAGEAVSRQLQDFESRIVKLNTIMDVQEKQQQSLLRNFDAIDLRLRKIEASITRVETILNNNEQRQGGRFR
ncbi:MAG: hypothetical protein LBB79_03850 [Prevotellaceae bacterium]|jgi:tRNA A58 N-methylase Trm61|nr:hypothetical protein [Prevotellaceae bacterium]